MTITDHALTTRQDHDDRADFAIVDLESERVLGGVVLNELDTDDESCNFRIGLVGPEVYGRGYGTEATRLIVMGVLATDPRPRVGES